jgi:AcrR family transcriptional regulator
MRDEEGKMGDEPKGKADVAVRGRLLRSATGIFTRKGYASATVREIVADAGVTKPALYYYFRNKEGIYLELMREGFSKFDSLLDVSRREPGDAVRKIKRLCDEVFGLFLEHIEVARVMYAIYYGPPQGAPFFDFDAYHFKFQDMVRCQVGEGIRTGEFRKRDPVDMAWAIIGAVNVAMESQLCHPEIGLGKEGLARVLDVLFEGIRAKTRPARRSASGPRGRYRGAGPRSRKGIRKGEPL